MWALNQLPDIKDVLCASKDVSWAYGKGEKCLRRGGNVKGSRVSVWVSDGKITANLREREEEKQAITGLRIQGKKYKTLEDI